MYTYIDIVLTIAFLLSILICCITIIIIYFIIVYTITVNYDHLRQFVQGWSERVENVKKCNLCTNNSIYLWK